MSGPQDVDSSRRNYQKPYGRRNPIPTIARYEEEKENRRANAIGGDVDNAEGANLGPSRTERAKEGLKKYWNGSDVEDGDAGVAEAGDHGNSTTATDEKEGGDEHEDATSHARDTSETAGGASDPKAQRERQKKHKDERAERKVTDPITHLPITISDFTTQSLEEIDENPTPFGSTSRTATGLQNKEKSSSELKDERDELRRGHDSMKALFPPPSFEDLRTDVISTNKVGVTAGLSGTAAIFLLMLSAERFLRTERIANMVGVQDFHGMLYVSGVWLLVGLVSIALVWELIGGVRTWTANRINEVWEEQVWESNFEAREREATAHETESVSWLNSLIGSVWPLINPDLFISLADTLEDVMQASLPGLVQMVSVEDLGQGSESLRILGIRWLPSGAAARAVGADGQIESEKESKKSRVGVKHEEQVNDSAGGEGDTNGETQDEDQEGFEAEEGDFVNLEVAFAYRARPSNSMAERTKDMHLYLAFYLPMNIKIPVYVDMRGLVGICRLRLQQTPDPPFFALCTITFLGQPKVDISCIPLVKRGLNLMDLPLISNFVQSSVDAAIAEYVAPKSLTLDLKDMLVGDDFKKDTVAKGVLVIDIIRGFDFRTGDAAIPLIRSEASSDPYVSVAWAKFGKPLFSTRVLVKEMEPYWRERCYLLVTPQELDVGERVRLQLWDSDRFTADDDLGRVEVDLKKIMTSDETNGRMHTRVDGFKALKAGEEMPGKLEWGIGYFSKTRLQDCQFEYQTYDKEVRSMQQLRDKANASCQRKLREAQIKQGRHSHDADELEQQKKQEIKMMEDAMTASAPPPDDYPSGIFSIQVHNITGLSLQKLSKSDTEKEIHHEDEEEDGTDLPSAYCTVIINHKKIFKTRTKPRNGKPFYNAGTERFIADWRNTEVHVSIRDARVDEDDPLIGIVHLPLEEVFKERAQINAVYPLTGGIGYGRVRISMMWRSVQLRASPEKLGWEYGTLEVKSGVSSVGVPEDLQNLKLKLHSNISSGKLYVDKGSAGWKSRKGDRSLYLPFQKRYASCLGVRLKRNAMIGKDHTAAFAVLWLKDIVDDEEQEFTLPVWRGDYERATASCLDEPGEKVGEIKLKVTFWAGLGAAHRRWASKYPDLANVLEVLDCARDNLESSEVEKKQGIREGDGNDTSDSSSDEEDNDSSEESGDDVQTTTKTNMLDDVKAARHEKGQKHRMHRGVMQYKLPRSAKWASGKIDRVESKISNLFHRHTREPGIETEV